MTAAILLRGHFHGLTLRLQARRSRDADQTRHVLRPPKDRLGWDSRRRLALACGPTPAVHRVALWLLEANPGTLCRPGIARPSPRTCDSNQFLGDTQARDFQNPGLGPCLGYWSGPRSRSHDGGRRHGCRDAPKHWHASSGYMQPTLAGKISTFPRRLERR
jgi:hypothetical protein